MAGKMYGTGDTHGILSIYKLLVENFQEGAFLDKEDYLIVAGDFGLLWGGSRQPESDWWLNWLHDQPWTTLFVDGNHENHEMLACLDTVGMFGSEVGKVNDSVFHLRRGHVYNINGKKVLTIGGAESIDKARRTEGVNWWPGELITHTEENEILKKLEFVNEVDYIITHTCPLTVFQLMGLNQWKKNDPTMKFLDFIYNKINFKNWYFGHFHEDRSFGKLRCLYNDVVEIC